MPVSGDEDVVVRELDVYINDSIDLFLMQYMLRSAHAPAPNIKHAQFKPKHKILEVYTEHPAKRDGHLKLTSSVVPHKAQLGVAILSEDGLHITPLQEVLQMRPDFKNVPPGRGDESNAHAATGVGNEDDEEEERSQRPVVQQVLLKKKESDRAQSARVQSFAYLQTQEENEAFRKLATYNMDESEQMFERMYYEEKAAGDAEGDTGAAMAMEEA